MENDYQRLFFIFKNMNTGYGNPTGFIKVEINNDVTRLQLSLGNIAARTGITYKLYGIFKDDNHFRYTDICNIPVINGRADIKLSAESKKIGSNKLNIKDINIYAIIIIINEKVPSVVCPLVAYTKGELEWKKQFDRLILEEQRGENVQSPSQGQKPGESVSPYVELTEKKYEVQESAAGPAVVPNPIQQVAETAEKADIQSTGKSDNAFVNTDEADTAIENENEAGGFFAYPDESGGNEIQESAGAKQQTEADSEELQQTGGDFKEAGEAMQEIQELKVLQEIQDLQDLQEVIEAAQKQPQNGNEIIYSNFYSDIYPDDGNYTGISGSKLNHAQNLKEDLDNNFEKYNPFNTKNKRFRWWKINSPGYLNNVLFRNNVKSYLLFSPNVMLAHYKYKYIIFGIRANKYAGKEMLICGVPGVYGIDDNPFEKLGSWVQPEGYRPKYGAFGYWLVMIDSKTGKLMKIK